MNLNDLLASSAATLTPTDAGQILGCDPRTVGRGIEDGTIPAIRVGRRVMIPRIPFLRMLGVEEPTAA